MDRLVCGDVGFGKTEIAVRAAFKAATDSKQVAVLVPTTILALQHYKTFKRRLKDFPCNIEYISRLKTAKEIKQIAENLKSGKTDIVIGTHRILNKEIQFKDLGLLIIDEEQKFGVAAKERLKQLKLSVDTLTLTAGIKCIVYVACIVDCKNNICILVCKIDISIACACLCFVCFS